MGRLREALFLIVAACFLADTWLGTLDAVSRAYAENIVNFFPGAKSFSIRRWYYLMIILLSAATTVTMFFDAPGPLLLISAVIGFVGTVTFSIAILVLNHWRLPGILPQWARPSRLGRFIMILVCIAYLALAAAYLWLRFSQAV